MHVFKDLLELWTTTQKPTRLSCDNVKTMEKICPFEGHGILVSMFTAVDVHFCNLKTIGKHITNNIELEKLVQSSKYRRLDTRLGKRLSSTTVASDSAFARGNVSHAISQ